MTAWHKRRVEFWKSKPGVSEYGMLWIAFIEGILLGMLVYHFGIANWFLVWAEWTETIIHFILKWLGYAFIAFGAVMVGVYECEKTLCKAHISLNTFKR